MLNITHPGNYPAYPHCRSDAMQCFVNTADTLEKKVRELYDIVCRLEDEKYDWEFKLRKMDFEVRESSLASCYQRHFVVPFASPKFNRRQLDILYFVGWLF